MLWQSTNEGQLAFKEKIQKSGAMGFLMIAGLELAQIFLAVLPGEPIEILAGMCYGGIGGTIFILLMTMISEAAIFVIVRKLGSKFVYEFCKEETVKKIENSNLFKNPKKSIIFYTRNTQRFINIYSRITANKDVKISSNINACKNTISNIFNTCRGKHNEWILETCNNNVWCNIPNSINNNGNLFFI